MSASDVSPQRPEESAALIQRLDEIRAELGDIANRLPLSDAQMCVKSAKDSLAMAQDLIGANDG